MEKKLKLKGEVYFVLGFICAIILMIVMNYGINNYKDYLDRCDIERGYTCNIFGK
jgi:hypothetical protein